MKINVGKVLKAQGIRGEMKLICYLDNSSMLRGVKKLYIGANAHDVEGMRCEGQYAYVKLANVSDRNAAEALRNLEVFADKESIALPAGRFFVDDLIGCAVLLSDGREVGKVVDILQYGAADVFVCSDNGKEFSFPFLKDFVSVDIQNKKIIAEEKRFGEVVLYED